MTYCALHNHTSQGAGTRSAGGAGERDGRDQGEADAGPRSARRRPAGRRGRARGEGTRGGEGGVGVLRGEGPADAAACGGAGGPVRREVRGGLRRLVLRASPGEDVIM
uniref:Uncharacterized protein n=1 Tax=Zea mays TaxID=4577 RepID=B4FGR8_MAIZE|nr:unknown [Zea mays]